MDPRFVHVVKFVQPKIDLQSRHETYDKEYLFAEVAVVGGGPAGMSAALEAAAAGCDVILIDENQRLGGSLLYGRIDGDPNRGPSLATDLARQVADHGSIRVLDRGTCTGWFADNWLVVVRGQRLYKLRAGQVVLASGATEQPMVFRNNDLPGVVLASAAQRLLRL